MLNRIVTKRFKYFGHVMKMQTTRYPKMVMEKAILKDTDPEVHHHQDCHRDIRMVIYHHTEAVAPDAGIGQGRSG